MSPSLMQKQILNLHPGRYGKRSEEFEEKSELKKKKIDVYGSMKSRLFKSILVVNVNTIVG